MIWKIQKKKTRETFFFVEQYATRNEPLAEKCIRTRRQNSGNLDTGREHHRLNTVNNSVFLPLLELIFDFFRRGSGVWKNTIFIHSSFYLRLFFFFNLLIFSCLFFFPSTSSSSYFRFLLITVTGYCLFTQI